MNTEFLTNGDDDEVTIPKSGSSGIFWLTASEILDKFGDELTDTQKEMLRETTNNEKPTLTENNIRETIKTITYNSVPIITLYQYCFGVKGMVVRTEQDLKICGDPNCRNCKEIDDKLLKYLKSYV